ncbi:MAG: hypothetical protein Q8O26_10360 [Phreatobacter sp.]|uniref:hypothetical protein n=1 Tax=Phreatobacter sp. TaxID=1966341 RepID=UPI002736A1AE|nr:hypothetical protein [Phreatobacter sp.]MDP2802275.1 hypothetical protein [Phreatobacter sp.]
MTPPCLTVSRGAPDGPVALARSSTLNQSRADIAIIRPSPTLLTQFSGERRLSVRPLEVREADFDAKFDADTLFYDAFIGIRGRIVLVGPPFLNLRPALEAATIEAKPSGRVCSFELREMDRHGQIHVVAPDGTDALVITSPLGRVEVKVQPSEVDVFAGRRVIFTQSRNNDLVWIQDWVRYARDIHGADAVLLYDNASTRYTPEDIADALGAISGIAAIRIVDWPFKYGPQGLDAKRFWDSDFCQHGAWEHARRRFLEAARSVQNADVDELVVSADGQSVFAAAEADPFGILRYRGRWIVGTGDPAASLAPRLRHADFDTVQREKLQRRFGVLRRDVLACPAKWSLVPSRCPDKAQWRVHTVGHWLPALRTSAAFGYRHFREINDNWKYARTRADRYDPAIHEVDARLKAHFARVDWTA